MRAMATYMAILGSVVSACAANAQEIKPIDGEAVKHANSMWAGCVMAETVKLAKKSTEPADVLASAIMGICYEFEQALHKAIQPSLREADRNRVVNDRSSNLRRIALGEIVLIRAGTPSR